eukprot:6449228-Heterocapsa_arctica.AAC.1
MGVRVGLAAGAAAKWASRCGKRNAQNGSLSVGFPRKDHSGRPTRRMNSIRRQHQSTWGTVSSNTGRPTLRRQHQRKLLPFRMKINTRPLIRDARPFHTKD